LYFLKVIKRKLSATMKTIRIQYLIFTYPESWYKWLYCSIRRMCFIL